MDSYSAKKTPASKETAKSSSTDQDYVDSLIYRINSTKSEIAIKDRQIQDLKETIENYRRKYE